MPSELRVGATKWNRAIENIRVALAISLEDLNAMNETELSRKQLQLLSDLTQQQLQISLQLDMLEQFKDSVREIDARIKTGELKTDPKTGKLRLADEIEGEQ